MMSDKECIEQIKTIAKDYCNNTDDSLWADWFMERIIDVLSEYDHRKF